jgi:hypothetical protein
MVKYSSFPTKLISLFLSIFIFFISITISYAKLNPAKVELAINCGGKAYKGDKGILYQEDKFFNNGETSDYGKNSDIQGTKDKIIYQTERWSSNNFEYNIPIKSQGSYVLILKFSEVYFSNPNEKIFDINFGDQNIIKNLDIFKNAGKNFAYDEYIEFIIKNDNVYFNNKLISSAFNKEKKTLNIKFIKTIKDNPKINGIILVKGTIDDTDYDEYKNKLESIEKNKSGRNERGFARLSKTIDFEDFEDDFVDDGKKFRSSNGIFSLTSLMTISLIGGASYYFLISKKKY